MCNYSNCSNRPFYQSTMSTCAINLKFLFTVVIYLKLIKSTFGFTNLVCLLVAVLTWALPRTQILNNDDFLWDSKRLFQKVLQMSHTQSVRYFQNSGKCYNFNLVIFNKSCRQTTKYLIFIMLAVLVKKCILSLFLAIYCWRKGNGTYFRSNWLCF